MPLASLSAAMVAVTVGEADPSGVPAAASVVDPEAWVVGGCEPARVTHGS